MLDPFYNLIGLILAFFYRFVPPHNLGIAIILLTVTVMIVLFPLNAKQARSMIEMQRAQPEIKKLQAQYKDDKQKLNEEVLKFYQEHQINPLSGCLPIVVQMPVLFALFHVIRNVKGNVPQTGAFNKLYLDACDTAELCHNSGQKFLGLDLTKSAGEARDLVSFVGWLPYLIVLILITATGWYQAQQTMARQKRTSNAPVNTQMQIVTKVMPIVFGVLSFNFASGLVVYWVTRNVWLIGQQHFVINKMYEEAHAKGAIGSGDGANGSGDSSGKSSGKSTSTKSLNAEPSAGHTGSGKAKAGGNGSANPKADAKAAAAAAAAQRPRNKRKKKR